MIQSRPGESWETEGQTCAPGQEPKDRLRQHGEDAKREAEDLRNKAGEVAHETGERMKEAGRQARDRATEAARQTTSQVKERAGAVVSQQKNRLAEEVHVFGEALHCAADTLDENNDQTLGRYAHQAADFCDSCSRYLRETDGSELVRGVGEFTRRHPELVLGGLFLAGVSVARFLKASDRHRDEERFNRFNRDLSRDYEFDRVEPVGASMAGQPYGDAGYGDVGLYAGEDRRTAQNSSPAFSPIVEDEAVIVETEETSTLGSQKPLGGACDVKDPSELNQPR